MEVQNVSWHKDEESALLYRIEGNHFLKKKKFFETLLSYNQSLCNATPDSEEMGFAYSNRSIVYLDVHEYKLCLDNIELARASAYPASKLPVLEAREEKCKRIVEGIKKTEGVDTFFKLSHPANQKIPFIAKCLELRKNKQFGRHIITNKDLQSGDIIAIEEPFFKSADGDGIFTRCTFCLRSNKMSLIPSDISSQAMFCSKKCMETANNVFYRSEWETQFSDFGHRIFHEALAMCDGDFQKLKQLLDDPELSKKTIFDLDLNKGSVYERLVVFNSLQVAPEGPEDDENLPDYAVLKTDEQREIAKRFIQKVSRIIQVNNIGIDWHIPLKDEDSIGVDVFKQFDVGAGILLFGSLFNHSCIHNVDRIVVDNQVVFYAKRFIPRHQQLFINYGPFFALHNRDDRQAALKEQYGFTCTCEACENKYPIFFEYQLMRLQPYIKDFPSIKECKAEFKKNCEVMTKRQTTALDMDMLELMFRNMYLLTLIAKIEPFMFLP